MPSKANKRQVGGDHYKGGEEHWDRTVRLNLDYFQAQITKYVERARKKNGKQDIEKASHFCEKYLEVYDKMYPKNVITKSVRKARARLRGAG